MDMKKILLFWVMMLPLCVVCGQSSAVAEKVSETVYKIEVNKSVNVVAVIDGDGVLLYDTGYKGRGEAIEAAVKTFTQLPVKAVYNTHHHSDHTGSNAYFAERGVKIYATQKTIDKLQAADKMELWSLGENMNEWSDAHSGSDVTLYMNDEKVAVVGDMLFEERFPYIDTDAGGDVTVYLETQGEIISSLPADVKIIGGHGRVYTLEEYEALNSLLWETYDKVKELVMADESLEAIKKADPLVDYAHLEWGLVNKDKWVEIIYSSLR